ncbi:hypothetical protein [Mesorhizobium sp. NZP2298]|uniref:hypothetical protein n=1 Tax=Mesorhizobium sp. NZP2298 TaxID=2483403 RepID=UPI001552E1F7|nr:hypothetical protein [Mesorhizobium sp. NZP2298]
MTFVVAAAQALGCAAELRMQGSDSAGQDNGAGWSNGRRVAVAFLGRKKNKPGYRLFFKRLLPLAK